MQFKGESFTLTNRKPAKLLCSESFALAKNYFFFCEIRRQKTKVALYKRLADGADEAAFTAADAVVEKVDNKRPIAESEICSNWTNSKKWQTEQDLFQ